MENCRRFSPGGLFALLLLVYTVDTVYSTSVLSDVCSLELPEAHCNYYWVHQDFESPAWVNIIFPATEIQKQITVRIYRGTYETLVTDPIESVDYTVQTISGNTNLSNTVDVVFDPVDSTSGGVPHSNHRYNQPSMLALLFYAVVYIIFPSPKPSQLYIVLLCGVLSIFTVPCLAGPTQICKSIGLGVSNVTDCVGDTCTARFASSGVGILDENFASCITIQNITTVANTTIIPTHNISFNVMDAEYKFPLELKKVGAEIKLTYNAYCEKSLIGNKLTDCSLAPLTGYYPINFCHIDRQYQRDSLFNGWRDVAVRIGLTVTPRYYHYKVPRGPTLQSAVAFTYDNVSDVKDWSLVAPLTVNIGSKLEINLYSPTYMQQPVIGSDLVLDSWAPYDLYEITNINNVGEHKNDLYDAIHFHGNGTLLYDIVKLRQLLTVKLLKCEDADTRVQVSLPYADLDVALENKRLAKEGLRSKYPSMKFYNEDEYRMNDEYSSNVGFSHLSATATSAVDYQKTGPSAIGNYTTILLSSGMPISIGYSPNRACIISFSEGSWTSIPGVIYKVKDGTYNGSAWIGCSSNDMLWIYGLTSGTLNAWPIDEYRNFTNVYGEKFVFSWLSINISTAYTTSDSHLIFPFEEPGSFQYTIKGQVIGKFFTNEVCPEISKVVDNSTERRIYLTARSTCGAGNTILTTSNSLAFVSKSVQLSDAPQTYLIDRISNMSGPVLIGLSSLQEVKKTIKLKYFPTNDVVDETVADDVDEEPQFHLDTTNYWNPHSFLSGFSGFHIGHKIFAVLYMIAYVALGIVVVSVLAWVVYKILCWLMNTKYTPKFLSNRWMKPKTMSFEEAFRKYKKM